MRHSPGWGKKMPIPMASSRMMGRCTAISFDFTLSHVVFSFFSVGAFGFSTTFSVGVLIVFLV